MIRRNRADGLRRRMTFFTNRLLLTEPRIGGRYLTPSLAELQFSAYIDGLKFLNRDSLKDRGVKRRISYSKSG